MKKIVFLILIIFTLSACKIEQKKQVDENPLIENEIKVENIGQEELSNLESESEKIFEEKLDIEDIEKDLIDIEQIDI